MIDDTTAFSRAALLEDFEFPISTPKVFIIRAKQSGIGFMTKYAKYPENMIDKAIFIENLERIKKWQKMT